MVAWNHGSNYYKAMKRKRKSRKRFVLRGNNILVCLLCFLVILYLRLLFSYHPIDIDGGGRENNSPIGTKPWQEQQQEPQTQDGVSACLLVMDDNHFLTEWIAYHYHSLGLRRLVLAIDPKSQTSPLEILGRWKDKITITVWTADGDYSTPTGFSLMKEAIQRTFRETTPSLIEHRARQRLFYTSCLRFLKKESDLSYFNNNNHQINKQPAWTLLIDVDEFVRVNYQTASMWAEKSETNEAGRLPKGAMVPIDRPGSVATLLQSLAVPAAGDMPASGSSSTNNNNSTVDDAGQHQPPWEYLSSSPCIPLPRLRFVSTEDQTENNTGWLLVGDQKNNSFVTQNYKRHARGEDFNRNKISKTIIDLSRVPFEDILDVDSIHMPIRKHCSQRNRYRLPKDSLLVINHYLGSYDQFTYRENDARNEISNNNNNNNNRNNINEANATKVNVRNEQHFLDQQQFRYTPDSDDEIRPWLEGFSESRVGARDLLRGSGRLAPKSWKSPFGTNGGNADDKCALLFFGLARSYQDMVLPSLIENVLTPNARHGCDVFVHIYTQETDAVGRRNDGGDLRPNDIFLLEDAVHSVARDYYENTILRQQSILPEHSRQEYEPPIVAFAHDTPEAFLERRSEQLKRYHTKKTSVGRNGGANDTVLAYYPYAANTYQHSSLDNIVKQWHSIQASFMLMDYSAKIRGISYSRVGMFRSDCFYVTPIDIASLGKSTENSIGATKYDVHNKYFVTPSFARHPVNDRLVYGPYQAVKIWATKRFDLIEKSAELQNNPGYTMHSERFLGRSVFPAMKSSGFGHVENDNICFLRTRVGNAVFVNDCSIDGIHPTPLADVDWNTKPFFSAEKKRLSLVESLAGKSCKLLYDENDRKHSRTFAVCGK